MASCLRGFTVLRRATTTTVKIFWMTSILFICQVEILYCLQADVPCIAGYTETSDYEDKSPSNNNLILPVSGQCGAVEIYSCDTMK